MDSSDELENVGYFFIIISGLVAFLAFVLVFTRWDSGKKKKKRKLSDQLYDSVGDAGSKAELKPNIFRKKESKFPKWKSEKSVQFEHEWLLATLKAHIHDVTDIDFSPDGKFLVSVSNDRSLFLWNVLDFNEREHTVCRSHVDGDHATRAVFSPDSKYVILSLYMANKLAVYKLRKEKSFVKVVHVETAEFPKVHTGDISCIGIACNGRFVMSSSQNNQVVLYNTHGDVLKSIEPKLNILYKTVVSPCGRYIASSGFTPDVLVSFVQSDNSENFQDLKKAFELKGHTSGVYSFAFDQFSSKCVTASKDGTWKIFNTDIRYAQGEEAKIISSGKLDALKSAPPSSVHVAVSPSGRSFAISAGNNVHIFSAAEPQKSFKTISGVHENSIAALQISLCGRLIATCGDRYIRVFHNVAEFYSDVSILQSEVNKAREEARKRRLTEQLEEAKQAYCSVPGCSL